VIVLFALYGVIHPPTTVRADTAIDIVPLQSMVDVSNLPSPSPSTALLETTTKPFLTPDPDALRNWKELLRQVPGVVPPTPMMVDDPSPLVGAPTPSTSAPGVTGQFEGLANSDNAALTGSMVLPPDDGLGVGPSQVFQMVNIVGRISDKLGSPSSSFSLRSFFGVDSGFGESDPRVIYDAISGRWFAVYLQYSIAQSSSSIILAVSTTNDPTGTFCRYRVGNPTVEMFLQDYPMLGVSDDKVVISYNGFAFPGLAFIGAGYYVLNKADLTACSAAVRLARSAPSPTSVTPHPGQSLTSTSDLFMPMHGSPSTITLFRISGVPGVSPVTATSSSFPIRAWNAPPSASQAGSAVLLDTGDDRMLSVAWRNNSLWLTGNEACTPTGDSSARSCLRLVELATDTATVRQDMTFGASGVYDYYPALRPDAAANLHVVFTSSSASTFAGAQVTGRLATDPPNTLGPSTQIRAGGGAQTDPSGRMGDYSAAALDPSDTSLVWVVAEYIQASGGANWGTFIARLQMVAGTSTVVDFDNPAPPGASGSLLNGVFQGIDFGTGRWRWETAFAADATNHIYFDSATGTSRTFTFSPAPRVLNSMRVFTPTAGTLTLTDNLGQTRTQAITVGTMQLVNTGWTQPSTTVTVNFTAGWDLGVDDIAFSQTAPNPNPLPTTSGLSPASVPAGGPDFTLTVNGSNFISGASRVRWNSVDRMTTFVSSSQLRALIPASDIANPGTAQVAVFNPAPGGGTSNAQTFTITAAPNPVPTTTSVNPTSATAGGPDFTLTVNGSNFISGVSTVRWNSVDRMTTFVSSSQLRALIPASDIANPGTAQVTVFNPAPGGGTSNAQTFTITASSTTTTVTFDNPVPPGSSGSFLNGLFQGIDFGANQWRWENPYGADPTRHIYFDSSSGTSRTFTFSPGPRTLVSMRVFTGVAGTLTLTDNLGQTSMQAITTGSMQLVTTGWAQPSTTVTVTFTAGWELGVDDIVYRSP